MFYRKSFYQTSFYQTFFNQAFFNRAFFYRILTALLLASGLLLSGCGGGGGGEDSGSGSTVQSNANIPPVNPPPASTPPASTPQQLTMQPASVTVTEGAAQVFSASPAPGSTASGTSLIWSVQEANGGSIDASGHYTAPMIAGVFHVHAVDSTNSSGIATVTVTAPTTPPPTTAGRPGPSNTGVPAGTQLTASGSLRITTAGAMIDSLDITGCVDVEAPNVTIRRTRIDCDSFYPVRVHDGASLTIEDSEIAGERANGNATSGIGFANYVARRLNIHGTADGLKADDNVVVEDSWIHDLYLNAGDHADGVQSTGGSNSQTSITITHNFIDIVDHGKGHGGAPNSCFQIGTEWGSNANWTISGNWLYGGGWVVHVDAGSGHNNFVSNNRFGRGNAEVQGQPNYPDFGPISVLGDWVESGNVWDDTGAPL